MELRHLVKEFEEKQFGTWVCPIIKCFCDHECYCFLPKGFALLLKDKKHYSSYWGQRFSKSEDILKWGRSLERKVTVINYYIYSPACKLLDAIINLGGFNA